MSDEPNPANDNEYEPHCITGCAAPVYAQTGDDVLLCLKCYCELTSVDREIQP